PSARRDGPGPPTAYTQVRPELVVEVVVDTTVEHPRWRHAARFVRLRPDLKAGRPRATVALRRGRGRRTGRSLLGVDRRGRSAGRSTFSLAGHGHPSGAGDHDPRSGWPGQVADDLSWVAAAAQ